MESRWWLVCLCLGALTDGTRQNSMSCDRVRKLLQQPNVTAGVLNTPGTGSDLQVCLSHSTTCCTRIVEEQYLSAVHQDIQNLLQTFSFNLKLLITQNIATLQVTGHGKALRVAECEQRLVPERIFQKGIAHSSGSVFKTYVSQKANQANKYGFWFSAVQPPDTRLKQFCGVVHHPEQFGVISQTQSHKDVLKKNSS